MKLNKYHWYDGWFYDQFIAPNQDRLFKTIKGVIKPESSVIDIGCGTGRFSFSVEEKCKKIVGIDLSIKNIKKANSNLSKRKNRKIEFIHNSVDALVSEEIEKFDYAVMTYVIHEVDESERIPLLNNISKIADKIIIGDYLVPKQKGIWSILNNVIEYLAGKEHYKNYKNYNEIGGLLFLAKQAELLVTFEKKNHPKTSHLLILEKHNLLPKN